MYAIPGSAPERSGGMARVTKPALQGAAPLDPAPPVIAVANDGSAAAALPGVVMDGRVEMGVPPSR